MLSLVVNNYVYLQNIIQTFGVICSAHNKRQFIDFLHEHSTRYSVVNNDEQTALLLYDVYYLRVIYGRIIYRPSIVFRIERASVVFQISTKVTIKYRRAHSRTRYFFRDRIISSRRRKFSVEINRPSKCRCERYCTVDIFRADY